MTEDALKLSVYFGDVHTTGPELTSDVLMDCFERRGLVVAALFCGIEGFGPNRRIHAERFPDVSTDLPLLAVAVDTREKIESVLADVDRTASSGLVTLEYVLMASGEDVALATLPERPGWAKLTVYCGRGERARGRSTYREVVNRLRRAGAPTATVFLGVDGMYHGRRERATLFSRNARVPMMIVALGTADILRPVLTNLHEILERPLVSLERIALLKHAGRLLERPPTISDGDPAGANLWQAITVCTRQTAKVDGRSLYTELTRRLREGGAAGATTIRGEWGFSRDEEPHGDRLGTIISHAPTETICVDRADKLAELWPIIDETTVEHGIVTSRLVAAYRERAPEFTAGSLRLPHESIA